MDSKFIKMSLHQQDLATQAKLTSKDQPLIFKEAIIRKATIADLPDLIGLETICFEPWRRDSDKVIANSINHPSREVWLIQHNVTNEILATLFLRWNKQHLHLYSLATDPHHRSCGYGDTLIDLAEHRALHLGYSTITIEADANRPELISYYQRRNYTINKSLKDFYASGRDAYRLTKKITHTNA
jgi:ribosomal protein S18 acetylase RimI-like enzyme